MLSDFLPNRIYSIIDNKVNIKLLNEIRIREGKPILIFLNGQAYFLSSQGITNDLSKSIIATKDVIDDIVFRASECSIYASNEQICKGYLMTEGGVRIGLAGTIVKEGDKIKTMKDFSSLNIRIPHNINGASLNAFPHMVDDLGIKNTLIISPPGSGKTTFIRDFVDQLSERNFCLNVSIIDERGEIVGKQKNGDALVKSNFFDTLSFCDKPTAITWSIRVLTPNLIVTDELASKEDVDATINAINCGAKVLSTIHADNLESLKNKNDFKNLFEGKYFERYVVLSSRNGPGTYEGIYGQNFERIKLF